MISSKLCNTIYYIQRQIKDNFNFMLLNPFTVLLNNNDARPITTELIESEIPQQNINVFN